VSNEKPILFKDDMIRAILEGRKCQTRRLLKPQPEQPGPGYYFDAYNGGPQWNWWDKDHRQHLGQIFKCPYGKPGGRLWVRETWCAVDDTDLNGDRWVDYRATPKYSAEHPAGWENAPDSPEALKWRPSIHMPRWASRITLEITDVRVERLQDISAADAKAEGVARPDLNGWCDEGKWVSQFAWLWQSINGPDSWDANPWVWVIEFKRIDQEAKAA
jgi:hypothetical protein